MIHHRTAVIEGVVGDGTFIGAFAWIGPHVTIGHNCVIGPGCAIGQDGFGYTQQENGTWLRKPQSHGVVIEDDVHIGANTCIDRGSWRDTHIGAGTRIDNLCHIAHNVVIGRNCLIVAQVMLAGSVQLGDGAYVAPCASVRQRLTIGANAFIGMGAVVVKNVAEDECVKGVPAKRFQPGPAGVPVIAARRDVAP